MFPIRTTKRGGEVLVSRLTIEIEIEVQRAKKRESQNQFKESFIRGLYQKDRIDQFLQKSYNCFRTIEFESMKRNFYLNIHSLTA